jgi:cytochrome c5
MAGSTRNSSSPPEMPEPTARARPAFVIAAFALIIVWGASGERPRHASGPDVVARACAGCHAGGTNGAPRIGDAAAWASRSARGLSSLTTTALEGVRTMPAHGGTPTLGDLEMRRAITHMVNQSGGNWAEPVDRRNLPASRGGQEIVEGQCVKCHGKGFAGAPRIGNRDAWVERGRLGFDGLVRSAINGHGAMPARGGMADLTDAEVRRAVAYMVDASVKPKARQ